jgi:hypothetical protein
MKECRSIEGVSNIQMQSRQETKVSTRAQMSDAEAGRND